MLSVQNQRAGCRPLGVPFGPEGSLCQVTRCRNARSSAMSERPPASQSLPSLGASLCSRFQTVPEHRHRPGVPQCQPASDCAPSPNSCPHHLVSEPGRCWGHGFPPRSQRSRLGRDTSATGPDSPRQTTRLRAVPCNPQPEDPLPAPCATGLLHTRSARRRAFHLTCPSPRPFFLSWLPPSWLAPVTP